MFWEFLDFQMSQDLFQYLEEMYNLNLTSGGRELGKPLLNSSQKNV